MRSVLQCVAVCCSVLQRVAVRSSVPYIHVLIMCVYVFAFRLLQQVVLKVWCVQS